MKFTKKNANDFFPEWMLKMFHSYIFCIAIVLKSNHIHIQSIIIIFFVVDLEKKIFKIA